MELDVSRLESASETLVGIVRERAFSTPEDRAYVFLENGEKESGVLTWGELDRQACALARGLPADGPALILCPPGLDFVAAFFGCLYAGVPAVPVHPPSSRRSLPRLQAVARDARPVTALTTSSLLARTAGWLDLAGDLPPLRWIAVDEVEDDPGSRGGLPAVAGDGLAFLQYTSGSTSRPRGVRVSHANLLHNQELIRAACGHSGSSIFVSWLPLFHDLGLIGNVLQAAFVGAPCILMAPAAFLQRPVRWLQAVSRYGATTSGGPDFSYDLCVRKIRPDQCEGLDLSRWAIAFNGAEPVRAATLRSFAQAFAPCGFRASAFYPCYGLAEATLMVSGGSAGASSTVRAFTAAGLERGLAIPASEGEAGARPLVGCGRPLGGQTVAAVDPATGRYLGPGEVGEVWIHGPSVAGGYWNRPEETAETFHARTADGAGPFLRTGDLGFFHEGELFLAGRLKDLIILRGRNLYPQDIEATTERSCPGAAPGSAAAFAVDDAGEERLIVVLELPRRRGQEPEAIAQRVRSAVFEEHEARVHEVVLISPGTLPRTSSGKVQRRLCRDLLQTGKLQVVARSLLAAADVAEEETELEGETLRALPPSERSAALAAWLRTRVARILHIAADHIPPGVPLASLGLDSLAAVELRGELAETLGLAIGLEDLFEDVTIERLTERLLAALAAGPSPASTPAPGSDGNEGFPLSAVQKALWILHQRAPESSAYHIAFALRLPEVDRGVLRRAFAQTVSRHEALRCTFSDAEGRPVQRVSEAARAELEEIDAAGWNDERLQEVVKEVAHRPFDLQRGPALRAVLFRSEAGDVLLFAIHHLICDGWSLWLLLRELSSLYHAESGDVPAPPRRGYADFVAWQRDRLAGGEAERLWEGWRPKLAGAQPLELPADLPRVPAAIRPGGIRPGGSHTFRIGPELTRRIRRLAAEHGTTLSTVVLAAYEVLLLRSTGQERFLVGVASWGRSAPGFEEVVGCFFNVLPVPAAPAPEISFAAHLQQVHRSVREALALQDLPSHLLAERLPAGDAGLFQATFLWQKPQRLGGSEVEFDPEGRWLALPGGLEVEPILVGRRHARQDLELEVLEAGETLVATLHYDAGLFRTATILRTAGHLEALLREIAANPQGALADFPLLVEGEEHLLRIELSGAGAGSERKDTSVVALFAEQARDRPDRLAAVHPDCEMTYGQLDERSDELAALLRGL